LWYVDWIFFYKRRSQCILGLNPWYPNLNSIPKKQQCNYIVRNRNLILFAWNIPLKWRFRFVQIKGWVYIEFTGGIDYNEQTLVYIEFTGGIDYNEQTIQNNLFEIKYCLNQHYDNLGCSVYWIEALFIQWLIGAVVIIW
jgi:hypothetical protein